MAANPLPVIALAGPDALDAIAATVEAMGDDNAWVALIGPRETLLGTRAAAMLAPLQARFDAVWGGVALGEDCGGDDSAGEDRGDETQSRSEASERLEPRNRTYALGDLSAVPNVARYGCDDRVNAMHAALHWWVGASCLMRAGVARALAAQLRSTLGAAEARDPETVATALFLAAWRDHRCLKIAEPLTSAVDLPERAPACRTMILDALERAPAWIALPAQRPGNGPSGGPESRPSGEQATVDLAYTGRNPTIERVQLRGVFYEQRELEAVAAALRPRAHIVDVGANTGNHACYLASHTDCRRITVFEAAPFTAGVLRETIARNGFDRVDIRHLGIACGASHATMRFKRSRKGHLGSARLEPLPTGTTLEGSSRAGDLVEEIPIAPLDALIDERVDFIKIDVEDMELDVLAGAERLIASHRPGLLVEVASANTGAFAAWLARWQYTVERVFPDQGYANYLVAPQGDRS